MSGIAPGHAASCLCAHAACAPGPDLVQIIGEGSFGKVYLAKWHETVRTLVGPARMWGPACAAAPREGRHGMQRPAAYAPAQPGHRLVANRCCAAGGLQGAAAHG